MAMNRREVQSFTSIVDTMHLSVCDFMKMFVEEVVPQKLLAKVAYLLEAQRGWLKIKNKDVFFHHETQALFPNLSNFEVGKCSILKEYDASTFLSEFEGYTGELMTKEEFHIAFANNFDFLEEKFQIKSPHFFTIVESNYFLNQQGTEVGEWNTSTMEFIEQNIIDDKEYFAKLGSDKSQYVLCSHIPIFRLKKEAVSTYSVSLLQLIWSGLIPDGLSTEEEKIFLFLPKVYQQAYQHHKNLFRVTENGYKFNEAEVGVEILNPLLSDMKQFLITNINSASYENTLLFCDNVRADIDPYNTRMLTDPNGGHWNLWDMEAPEENTIPVKLRIPLIGRNPIADVREDGIIGIDFGTKSTVVVFQKDSEFTMPMRVGTGKLSKEIDATHYENPTVLEFVDLENFFRAYIEKPGRPDTKWEQVTTSHTAFGNLLNSNSDQYYSFLYELKQWAGDKQRKIHLRDKKSRDFLLPPYLQLREGDFDPIEIYAYYLGLYINNMHNGIYLNYLLSYPVAYEKAIRDQMIDSFSRGIKKSLPETILTNKEVMENFQVCLGASEPIAYAICALQEYGFEPEEGQEIFYGVFDFGGGTSDFDFGLYRGVDEDQYDFVVDSFGSSGDRYLGGENLLELLAFEIFKKNQKTLREKCITFERPPECREFAGDEILISQSQEAKLNMTQLKEILRDLWERRSGYAEKFDTGVIKVSLFDNKGSLPTVVELDISVDELEKILRDRIEKGVANFFQSMFSYFRLSEDTYGITEVNILLAGNSSKSDILREIMEEYIRKYSIQIQGENSYTKEYFKVFPPLGTNEADEFLSMNGKPVKERSIQEPTCKTGVAFGLVSSREGGRVKLTSGAKTAKEVKFPYFLGREKRRKFHYITQPGVMYQTWTPFTKASEERFTLFYSKLPTVATGETSIAEVERKLCRLKQTDENAIVYIRAISPSEVEYVVATEEGIAMEKFITEPILVELED